MIINRCWRCMEDMGENKTCPHCGFDQSREKTLTYALKPNTILHGKYLIGKVLGQGGFGITYIGFDLTLELKVAIKEYFPFNQASRNTNKSYELSWQGSQAQSDLWRSGCHRFLAEARKMAKINSIPEIVSVRDTFEENKTAYIVMDYVPGMTIKDHVQKNGAFSYEECMDLLLPLVEGLERVHRQGIVHRDISPANLMLSPHGKVYLLDLGAAKDLKTSSGHSEMVATMGYSPMEQYANSSQTGPWSDVYSMTASIYYCLFGKTPPAAVDRVEKDLLDLKSGAKVPLTKNQIAVLKKGMAVRKEDRYQSAQELLNALRGARRPNGGKKKLIVAAVAAVAAIAVAAGMLIAKKPWLPSVETYGIEGPFINKNLVEVDNSYKYIVDLEGSLLRIDYNDEADTYYVDAGEVIFAQDPNMEADYVGGLTVTEDALYFTYLGGVDQPDYLYRANLDGTEQTVIAEIVGNHTYPQYVKLSNGDEYFYYMLDDSSDEETHLYLYRYDLQKGETELVIQEEMSAFVLYGKYIYYSVADMEQKVYTLKRATLAGDSIQVLDEEHSFYFGFVEDGKLYLLQNKTVSGDYSVGMVECGVDGKPVEEGKGVFNVDWYEEEWAVGGGWVYYWKADTDELHRVRLDGSADGIILEGNAYYSLTYHDGELYYQDGFADANGTVYPTQAYIAGYDGAYDVSCGMVSSSYLTTESGLQYQIDNGTVILKGYVGSSPDVILPESVDGYPVAEVDWDTFEYNSLSQDQIIFYKPMSLTELTYTKQSNGITITGYNGSKTGDYDSVAIPSEIDGKPVVEIGDQAFAEENFVNVYLPENLELIGKEAFDSCEDLEHIVIPATLRKIGDYAFWYSSLDGEEIVLPEGFTTLGRGVFFECDPKSIYLPASLSSYDNGFLAGCGGEYIVDANHKELYSEDGIIMSRDNKTLYSFPHDRTGTYTIPDTVEEIYDGAFYGAQINKVIMPDSVKTIGDHAFFYAEDLTSVVVSKEVEEIGYKAFFNTGLTQVTIPRGCDFDEENTFDVPYRYY